MFLILDYNYIKLYFIIYLLSEQCFLVEEIGTTHEKFS